MRNEKGITLVELLAALALISIITAVIASVLLTGTSSADRTTSKQQLQQEANYIVEVIRNEYLKNESQSIELEVLNSDGAQILLINDQEVSSGFFYCKEIPQNNNCSTYTNANISRSEDVAFNMFLIKDKNTSNFYEIDTVFSKLR